MSTSATTAVHQPSSTVQKPPSSTSSAAELLSTPDFAYLNWAFDKLDFMANEQDSAVRQLMAAAMVQNQPQQNDTANESETTANNNSSSSVATAITANGTYYQNPSLSLGTTTGSGTGARTHESERINALEKVVEVMLIDIRSSAHLIMKDTIMDTKYQLFELLMDPFQEVRMAAFNALMYLAILKRKHEDLSFVKLLHEREKLCGEYRQKAPLGPIDFALAFEMAMEVFSDEKDADLETFYQTFREYSSTGRKMTLSTV